jgi:hypothetical protein
MKNRPYIPSPALMVAVIALLDAVSGTAYAALSIPANSIGTKQLKNDAVTRTKLAANAVVGSKIAPGSLTASSIAPNSLTGADINVGTLGTVPSAASAPLAKVQIVTAVGTSGDGSVDTNYTSATATCPSGMYVLGGGVRLGDEADQFVNDAYPSANNAFTTDVANVGAGTPSFTAYAICGPAAASS